MLPRATVNAVTGHMWPVGRYIPNMTQRNP